MPDITTSLGKVIILFRGAYNITTQYKKLDVVTNDGSSYIYTNDTPSTGTALNSVAHWSILALKGTVPPDIIAKWSSVDIVVNELPFGSAPTGSVSQDENGTHIVLGIAESHWIEP